MADSPAPEEQATGTGLLPSLNNLIAKRGFQKWAARFPFTRRRVRREGEALFDLLAGFCHSQVLLAVVKLDIPARLMRGPMDCGALSAVTDVPVARMEVLLRAATALGLVRRKRNKRYALTQRGAALVGAPGLQEMIRHHDVLYRDLADPVAFFRGETSPELAGFWPYVFGGDVDPALARTYSELMAQSQLLVADDTLDAVSLKGVRRLMDIGGGTGAFLAEVAKRYDTLELTLFDLPPVVPEATERFAKNGLTARTKIEAGSFRTDSLPMGADTISLIRVLYDHADETVARLLTKIFEALPAGGRLIISEPMSGGETPTKAGDAYFALYTLAMGTGKTRSAAQIKALCLTAGFQSVDLVRTRRSFITSCVVAHKAQE
ncbi:Hydroxyneurosporene methyltransferase [Sulfitobacter noctilucicola]|uniref:Demethylspheroidene O-methyltransferase n=1 Tax=Sulfitobacter noctilucicola TaxID=1342301 RepID=A0A7W6MBW1_9RHOB|nr:methyltransferase [Sulfitobacter noctilucicola]KIN70041.1 Hydroxyneurosporene methyltransferase [Sulfitobacter noctilucicola]MBB4176054.1 demethylspheroidene O-methyltransferase [Sulfitobacter noctilucicola]